jgi:polysaccharide transporter, PST family
LRGGAEHVALWAQLSSVIELVAGVVGAGIASGLVVYVARAQRPERQREHLDEALRIGLRLAFPVAIAGGAAAWAFSDLLSGGKVAPFSFVLAAAAGWVAVIPVLVSNFWLGQQRRAPMLVLALVSTGLMLLVPVIAPDRYVFECLAVSQALPAAVWLLLPRLDQAAERPARRHHPLRRYVLPGLTIGILSPLSMLVARGAIGDALSWHDAGVFQALQRLADWVCLFAASFLSLHFLPRFAAAGTGPPLDAQIRTAAKTVLMPAAVALAGIGLAHRPLLELLYDASVQAPDGAVALFFAGNLLRIAAWIPLFALYAMHRTREITIGEFLSLPLFAALTLLAGKHLSLETAGAFWLASYFAYAIYNLQAVRRQQKSPTP